MHNCNEGDWLAQRLDALRPGWRGRVSLRVTGESGAGAIEELIGTIIGEPSLDPATADDDAVIDVTATLCSTTTTSASALLPENRAWWCAHPGSRTCNRCRLPAACVDAPRPWFSAPAKDGFSSRARPPPSRVRRPRTVRTTSR
jgi:hypothetical protein